MRKMITLAAAIVGGLIFSSTLLAQQDQRTAAQRTGDAARDAGNFLT